LKLKFQATLINILPNCLLIGLRRVALMLTLFLGLNAVQAQAQVFRPFKESRITETQWREYHEGVVAKLGSTLRDLEKDHLQMYFDGSTGITYTFTKPAHPAHPAWVSRIIVVVDGKYAANQAGFYAGSMGEFNLFYAGIAEMNERLRKGLSAIQ
jgi:hypothetical protein